MKKILLVILALSMTAFLFAEDSDNEPVPYSPDEFPEWARDLRRAEIIMIGSVPVSIIVSGLVYSLYRWAQNDFDSAYAPGLLGSQSARELDDTEKLGVLTVTMSISGLLALTDYILGKVRPEEE